MKKVELPADIMVRVANREEDAVRELYEATYKPLFAFLLSYTHNYADAEDLLQETYMKVIGAAHLYREKGNPMAWIMKIGKNQFLMQARKNQTQIVMESEDVEACEDIPLDQISDVDTRIWMEQLFTCLTREEQLIIILHTLMGFKHREIAQELDLPLGTVLTKYNRALKKLKNSEAMKGKKVRR